MSNSEKVLVTGARGFIGRNLIDRLQGRGADVVTVDHQILLKPRVLRKLILEEKPDVIYHLAAYGNHYFQKDSKEIVEANLIATFNLMEAIKDQKIKCFVNTGSSSEYGSKQKPMKEDMIPESNQFGQS